jgi:hypothetical protein
VADGVFVVDVAVRPPVVQECPAMSDRDRIATALRSLEGYVIGDGVGSTVTNGWAEIAMLAEHELDRPGAAFPCVWWSEDAAEGCFDRDGSLVATLHVHWRGDRNAIARALEQAGLDIDVPRDDASTFVIKPGKAALGGEWITVRASELVLGDAIDTPNGIGRVASVVVKGETIEIDVETGGGFYPTWTRRATQEFRIRRRRDDGPWVNVTARELRAGDVIDSGTDRSATTITSTSRRKGRLRIESAGDGRRVTTSKNPEERIRIRPRTKATGATNAKAKHDVPNRAPVPATRQRKGQPKATTRSAAAPTTAKRGKATAAKPATAKRGKATKAKPATAKRSKATKAKSHSKASR